MNKPFLEFLLSRRSVTANELHEPGPDQAQLDLILRAAHRVPDHGKIGPWRFVIFQGEARERFGNLLEQRFRQIDPEATQKLLNFERNRFLRAPLIIGVISSPAKHPKAPEWEQILSTGAACQNILLAAHSLGYGAQWLTEWYAFDEVIAKQLSLTSAEKIAGFIYIGSYDKPPSERVRPDLNERIKNF